jgi:hypothetical protein
MLSLFPVVTLLMDAARVIRLRMMAVGKSTPNEIVLMVTEKIKANCYVGTLNSFRFRRCRAFRFSLQRRAEPAWLVMSIAAFAARSARSCEETLGPRGPALKTLPIDWLRWCIDNDIKRSNGVA